MDFKFMWEHIAGGIIVRGTERDIGDMSSNSG